MFQSAALTVEQRVIDNRNNTHSFMVCKGDRKKKERISQEYTIVVESLE